MNDISNLINEYYKLFPNAHFFPEWFEIPDSEKIEMLKEAIRDKKDLSQTKLFERYQEIVKFDE